MIELIVMAIFGVVAYVFYKMMLKEPILPWKEKKFMNQIPHQIKRNKKEKA
ncbi:hypothetical protein M5V91_29845 (plasmid) [Cytobacillus pseudoceanisediminis]|uniref:hypothetical protein n=1 Tax=Cytobacillus pseudoceanisediminis TaxID=3051614 RepID=UPI002187152E|nr:hypothetical protein [Cytobacillus pseudoceanisediminis]UQX57005.1 hypothetical protein M5V91_29845 [Cytobacillus pseudoceanisediminis]